MLDYNVYYDVKLKNPTVDELSAFLKEITHFNVCEGLYDDLMGSKKALVKQLKAYEENNTFLIHNLTIDKWLFIIRGTRLKITPELIESYIDYDIDNPRYEMGGFSRVWNNWERDTVLEVVEPRQSNRGRGRLSEILNSEPIIATSNDTIRPYISTHLDSPITYTSSSQSRERGLHRLNSTYYEPTAVYPWHSNTEECDDEEDIYDDIDFFE